MLMKGINDDQSNRFQQSPRGGVRCLRHCHDPSTIKIRKPPSDNGGNRLAPEPVPPRLGQKLVRNFDVASTIPTQGAEAEDLATCPIRNTETSMSANMVSDTVGRFRLINRATKISSNLWVGPQAAQDRNIGSRDRAKPQVCGCTLL